MSITATELKMNLAKYLLMASTQDIYVTKNGKVIAKLTSPYQDKVGIAESLIGIIPGDVSLNEVKEERLSEI
ncbi:MAG: type II toxin-antitoxin system prevent-host-death family antitoxin [Clostridia bacterium]|nr:type II toxin-antitoxin system prevent-host-death family antitoxin [Clostridia bacterium]